MAWRDYLSELNAIPRLPPAYAPILINRAWHDLLDLKLWSFLVGFGDLYAPALITAGHVTTTQFGTTVVADATAAAALNAVGLNPPLASPQLGVGYQFRTDNPSLSSLLSTSSSGPLYNIVAWDSVNTMTLDRPYYGPSLPGVSYMAYRAYYAPPVADFLKYWAILNTSLGYSITGRKLNVSQAEIDATDPQRGTLNDAYCVSPFRTDWPVGSGGVVHELYPHPTNARVYNALFSRRGPDLGPNQDVPITFPKDVLMAKAFEHGCQWALENVSVYSELAQTNWVLAKSARLAYLYGNKVQPGRLMQAMRQDDEILLTQRPFRQGGSNFAFPLGGQFLQSHDITGLLNG